jgi:subtilisin family serine protease
MNSVPLSTDGLMANPGLKVGASSLVEPEVIYGMDAFFARLNGVSASGVSADAVPVLFDSMDALMVSLHGLSASADLVPSEKVTAAALAGNGMGLAGTADLVGAAALPARKEEPIEVAQKRALDKFGQFVKYEGRTIEILRPGDPRLKLKTEEVGYFEIADPERMKSIGFPTDITIRVSEQDILNPPSTRKTVDPFGPSTPKGESPKLPAFWTDPKVPITGEPNLSNVPVQKPLLPGEGSSPNNISKVIPRDLAAEAAFAAKFGLRNNPERVWTEKELKDAAKTTSFPATDGIVGIADFDKDGSRDLLLRNGATGELQIWYMNAIGNKIGEAPIVGIGNPGTSWVVEGVGDFNNDGSPDLVWRELGGGGQTGIWFMNNNNFVSSTYVATGTAVANLPANWRIDGVADFNNDNQTDFLWRDQNGGQIWVWTLNGGNFNGSAFQVTPTSPNQPADWKIVGVSDFNSDGIKDLFWRNNSTTQNGYWQMGAGLQTIASPSYFGGTGAVGWTIEDVGDLNANGVADLAWKSPDGSHWAWTLSVGAGGVPTLVSAPRLPGNNTGAGAPFVYPNFNSEYGFGMIDTSAAIAYLKNQGVALEVPDSVAFNNVAFNDARQNEIVNLPEAWSQGYTGQGIIVAVIDNGVSLNHPALAGNIWQNQGEIAGDGIDNDGNGFIDDRFGWDFINNDSDPNPGTFSAADSHGTQVSGVIASKLIAGGPQIQGGAYDAKIMALRAGSLSSIDWTASANSVRYAADNGAKVINLSFAAVVPTGVTVPILSSAVSYAVSKGALVVISAGNGGSDTIDNVFPAILAGTPGVVAVGATNAGNFGVGTANNAASQVASFSTGAGSTVRSYIAAPGQNVSTTTITSAGYNYQYTNGTSFSAPLVAAAVATIRQAAPGATPTQIIQALLQTADPSDIYV